MVSQGSLEFLRPDGAVIDLVPPESLNLEWLTRISFNEYSVRLLRATFALTEAFMCPVVMQDGGETVGMILPGAAIFSSENPNNGLAKFGAYSYIVAHTISSMSRKRECSLVGDGYLTAVSKSQIFREDCLYLVLWSSKVTDVDVFDARYSISLALNGFLLNITNRKIVTSMPVFEGAALRLRKSKAEVPQYIVTIMCDAFPFVEDSNFLFFYVYQVIEHLMFLEFDKGVVDFKAMVANLNNPHVVDLKNTMNKFNALVKEETRINKALTHVCAESALLAERILDGLGIQCMDMTFGEKIYNVRNVLIHSYHRLAIYQTDLGGLSEKLRLHLLKGLLE